MRKADNLPLSCAVVTKSGNLNFLEPSGPVQACNGTALPLHVYEQNVNKIEPCCNATVCSRQIQRRWQGLVILHGRKYLFSDFSWAVNEESAWSGVDCILNYVF